MGSEHRRADAVVSLLAAGALLMAAAAAWPGRVAADGGATGAGDAAVVDSVETTPEPIGAASGVYLSEQADAGARAFAMHCARCHGAELEGAFGPALVPLDPWQFRDAPLSTLFDRMRFEMPFDAPATLDVDTYLVILTFVLRENGYPSGDSALSHADGVIAGVVLDDPPDPNALPAD